MTTVREILIATRDQGVNARRADGAIVDEKNPEACCFCTVGGLHKVAGPHVTLRSQCYEELRDTASKLFPRDPRGYKLDPIDVNDDLGHDQVIQMFDATIERLPA
jgi:hypothetical protein